jgi:hypothetical protein
MFPYLSFAVVVFMLFAGFALGTLFGFSIRKLSWFDGDGGELVPLPEQVEADARKAVQFGGAAVIPMPRRKAS